MTSLAAGAPLAVQPGHLWVWLCPSDHRAVLVSSTCDEVGSAELVAGGQPEEICPTCGGRCSDRANIQPAKRNGGRIVVRVL